MNLSIAVAATLHVSEVAAEYQREDNIEGVEERPVRYVDYFSSHTPHALNKCNNPSLDLILKNSEKGWECASDCSSAHS